MTQIWISHQHVAERLQPLTHPNFEPPPTCSSKNNPRWTPHQRVAQRLAHTKADPPNSSVDESLNIYTQTLFFLPTCRWNQAKNFSHSEPLFLYTKTLQLLRKQWFPFQLSDYLYKHSSTSKKNQRFSLRLDDYLKT